MIKKLVLNLDYRIMQKATDPSQAQDKLFVLGRKNLSVERYEASYGIDKARLVSLVETMSCWFRQELSEWVSKPTKKC